MTLYIIIIISVPDAGQQNAVDSSKFHVNLEAEIGQRLRRRFVDVLGLNTLRSKTKDDLTDSLQLRCAHTDTRTPYNSLTVELRIYTNRVHFSKCTLIRYGTC